MLPSLPLVAALMIAAIGASTPAYPPHVVRVVGAARPGGEGAQGYGFTSMLGRPRYDANEQGLRVPFAGSVPTWTKGTLKQPPRIFLDFEAPTRIATVMSEGVPNHPVWLSWAMAPRERGKTRLTLVFRRDTTVAVRVDREHGVLLVIPRIPAPENALHPVPGPTPMDETTPSFPEVTASPLPAPSKRPTPTPPTPLPTATPLPMPSRTPAPMMTPWIPRPTMTPWIPRPTMTPWIPVRTPSPGATPAPLPSELGMIYLPGSPEPRETPTITISLPPSPLPGPVVTPVGTRPRGNVDVYAATSGAYGFYEEVAVGQTTAARADSQRVLGARLLTRSWPAGRDRTLTDGWLPWWGCGLDLYGSNVQYQDPVNAGGLHARQEYRSHLALTRGVRLSPLELQGGLGVQGRYETTWMAGGAASPGTIGMGWRAVLAPEIVATGRLPLFGSVEAYGEGAMAPFAMAWLPASAAAAPALGGSRFEVGLAASLGGLRLAGGYRRWSLAGAGYGETFQGPVITLGGWLDPELQ